MIHPARGHHAARSTLALIAAATLLAGCHAQKKAVTGNNVAMPDMDVVDGTTNDAMTDLDAVSADGLGLGGNAGNSSGPVAKSAGASAKNVEAVPAE